MEKTRNINPAVRIDLNVRGTAISNRQRQAACVGSVET